MKKVLSLVLAFAMILGSFGFVFASEFPDVPDTEYFSEPVSVLSGFGVIAGYPDGTFQPTKVVTRAEMVTMIVAALNIPVKGGATTKRFTDVELNHWAAGYIDYGASVGFVAGYPDGSFKPEKEVSYNEALTMLVAALGYTSEALPGEWPGNFVNKAQSLGILDICRTTGTAGAPRQDIACFLYSTLTQYIGYVDKDGAFHTNIGKDGKYDTMLNRLGATEIDPFTVRGTEDTLIDLDDYLGAYITAYVNDDGAIVAIGEVKSQYIEGDYTDDLADTYHFDGAKKVDYVSFKNGDPFTSDAAVDYVGQSGIKLAVKLSGKVVKEVYSMQQWVEPDTFYAVEDVQDIIEDEQKIDSYEFALDNNDEIDEDTFILEGVSSIKDIKEDDVVTVYKHTNGTNKNKIAKIQVASGKTVEGVITKINAKKSTFTIGGEGYKLNGSAEAENGVTEAKLRKLMEDETSATFVLDYDGKIFDYDAEGAITKDYAVLLGTAETTKFDTTYEFKMKLADGSTAVYEAKEDAYNAVKGKAGIVVEYKLTSDNVVKEVSVETKAPADGTFTSKGVYDNKTLTSNTVVFAFDGKDAKSADSYSIIKVDGLYGATYKNMSYIASDAGEFSAILVEGASNTDTVYAIVAAAAGTNKSGYIYTTLYDGDVTDFTFESAVADGNIYTTKAGAEFQLATLVLDGDGIVTSPKYTKFTAEEAKLTTTRGTVSGSVYTDGGKNKWTLDDDVAVYVFDLSDEEWSAGDSSALKASSSALDKVYLIDTSDKADDEYEIVVVIKK